MNETILRDFFYLDIDRVRSLVAQLRQGAPEALEKTNVHQGQAGVKLLEYAYERRESETRSVHHYMFALLEEALRGTKRILVIDEEYPQSQWTQDLPADGQLVLARGRIRFLDFENLVGALEAFPQLLATVTQMQRLSLKQKLQAGELNQDQYAKAIQDAERTSKVGMEKKDFKGLVEMIRELYSGTLRLKVFPFQNHRRYCLTGSVSVEHLQQPRGNLWLSGGMESESQWWAMGIVNRLHASDSSADGGQSLEDTLENLLLQFAKVGKFTTSIDFPALSFVPLAVYREL